VFGIPSSARVLTNASPDLAPYDESLELSRLVLLPVELAAASDNARSMRKLATHYRISPAVMRTWLFEAGIKPQTPGRPQLEVDLDAVREGRARGDTWKAIANNLVVAPETLRRRAARTP